MMWDIIYKVWGIILVIVIVIVVYKVYEYSSKSHGAIARTT